MGFLDKFMKKKGAGNDKAIETKNTESAVEAPKKPIKKEKEVEKTNKKTNVKLALNNRAMDVICYPLITEKSAHAESINQYSFIVSLTSNKNQIKKAIFDLYGVRPIGVRTASFDGKFVTFKRLYGRKSDFKKAIVTLPKGKSLDIHKGV